MFIKCGFGCDNPSNENKSWAFREVDPVDCEWIAEEFTSGKLRNFMDEKDRTSGNYFHTLCMLMLAGF